MMINDKYEVLEILGKGGNGIVYKVKEKMSGRILAVKETVLHPGESRQKKEKETAVLQECFHPALPVVLGSFWQEERHYMVMEYVEGVTLKEYVQKRGCLSQEKTIKFAGAVGEVLIFLHTRNQPIIYGDLKPQNIMVTAEEQIRLIDFGTAEWEQGATVKRKEAFDDKSLNGGCYASPGYAAPEQLKGQKADRRSDIYSFGAVLHYLLTGEDPELPPYIRRDLKECDGALSIGIQRVINKCLRVEPEQRYQNVERILFDLKKFSQKEKRARLLWQGKQAVGALLFLAFAGFFYQAFEDLQWGLAWNENKEFIRSLIFLILGILWRVFMLGSWNLRRNSYRLEKNIWKTDKQGIGLFLVLFMLGLWGLEIGVNAKESVEPLPVTIYDESGYKLLWRENQVNPLAGAFRLEIPEECFEVGKHYDITVTLSEKESEKISVRRFEVKTVKSSIEN